MNPTIDLLLQRKSVRAYAERPIEPEERHTILQAALRAPTAGNMMLYTILHVADAALKARLAETCDDQPFIATAPLVLLFLADYQRWYDLYVTGGVPERLQAAGQEMRKPGEGDLLLAACDALIAAQTAVIAAEAMGIGSCYIGDVIEQYEIHRDLFHLPPYALPVALICFGYPDEEAAARKQPSRFEERFIVHTDQYERLSAAQLAEMSSARNAQLAAAGPRPDGLDNIAQVNYFRKFSADFSIEMNRSVRAMLAGWTRGEQSEDR